MLWIGLLCGAVSAHASVAVLVEEPYGDIAGMAPTGHSAVYFDHICAASLTSLRACREGEMGVVISRYHNIAGYDWLAVPLVAYLYSVDSVDQIPDVMDAATEERMRNTYRRAHLARVAPDLKDGTAPSGNWYELVGAAYDRTLYGFRVKTTPEQDAVLIAQFNDRENTPKYNGAFRNCADFARVTVNRFYPHAIGRNFIADFGMTTPKHVAHALSNYGKSHPETEFSTFKIRQVAGSLPRSMPIRGAAESLLMRKRYVIPITLAYPTATAVMVAAYVTTGRFAMPKNAPVLVMTEESPSLMATETPTQSAATASVAPGVDEELPSPVGMVKASFSAETTGQFMP